jgi:hypothetical protein
MAVGGRDHFFAFPRCCIRSQSGEYNHVPEPPPPLSRQNACRVKIRSPSVSGCWIVNWLRRCLRKVVAGS